MTRALAMAAIVAGLVLVVVGVLAALGRPAARPPEPVLPTPVAIISPRPTGVLDAPPPPANPGSLTPVRVTVPELGIDLPVVPGNGVDAPLYKAASYPAPLLLPGEGGRSMLYAHARTGMFGPLFQGATGQHVTVTLSNGRVLRYVVRQYYRNWPISDLRWFEPSDHEELLLVTCTTYDPNDPRIVVVAEPE